MSQQVLELQSKHSSATATIEELWTQMHQLKDHNALLKAQKGGEMFDRVLRVARSVTVCCFRTFWAKSNSLRSSGVLRLVF